MYFVIKGKHTELMEKELTWVQPTDLQKHRNTIYTFNTHYPERLQDLGSIVKWGRVVADHQLPELLHGHTIAGVEDIGIGIFIKKKHGIRRFKVIKKLHTDKEISQKGIEIFVFSGKVGQNPQRAVVQGYQPISMYEKVDFSKPARDMQMGMMPAKLTHIMIIIGLSTMQDMKKETDLHKDICIYDPFAGSGTTNLIVNYLGYDTLGTDIETKHLETNFTRWQTQDLYDNNHTMAWYTHDICKPLEHTLGETYKNKNMLIVTEGWLGPIVGRQTTIEQVQQYQDQVYAIYSAFLHTIDSYFKNTITIVCSLPHYIHAHNTLYTKLQKQAQTYMLDIQEIKEVYQRENQYVGRKILIITRK